MSYNVHEGLTELPPCPHYADRMHRFDRKGQEISILDDQQVEASGGIGHPCKCGAALIQAAHIGPGYQLVEPLPEIN